MDCLQTGGRFRKVHSYNPTIVVLVLTEGDNSCNLFLSLPALIGTQGGGVNAVLQC